VFFICFAGGDDGGRRERRARAAQSKRRRGGGRGHRRGKSEFEVVFESSLFEVVLFEMSCLMFLWFQRFMPRCPVEADYLKLIVKCVIILFELCLFV
jgi:hypothetical protein